MKVLRIIARLNVGGPAKHVVWLSDRMRRDGHETVLVAGTVPSGEEDMSYFAAENGVEPVYVEELSRELSPKDVISLVKIYRLIWRERPDIIHTHTAKAGTVGRVAAFAYKWLTPGALIGRPRRVKVVHTFHGHVLHSYYGRAKTGVFRLIEKVLAAIATDRIVVISPQQLREINAEHGVGRRDQFRVIPLGIDLERIVSGAEGPVEDGAGSLASDTIIGCIGRLTEIKDIPLFLETARELAKSEEKLPLRFAVIGDGHLRHRLEELADELGVSEQVSFLGNREDVPEVLGGLHVVALTSKNEGTPLSLIEAMAAGKPLVATPVGGVVDLLGAVIEAHDGFEVRERGIAVTDRDPRAFAAAIRHLLLHQDLAARAAAAGREYVFKNYSVERLVRDITSLYSELLTTRSTDA